MNNCSPKVNLKEIYAEFFVLSTEYTFLNPNTVLSLNLQNSCWKQFVIYIRSGEVLACKVLYLCTWPLLYLGTAHHWLQTASPAMQMTGFTTIIVAEILPSLPCAWQVQQKFSHHHLNKKKFPIHSNEMFSPQFQLNNIFYSLLAKNIPGVQIYNAKNCQKKSQWKGRPKRNDRFHFLVTKSSSSNTTGERLGKGLILLYFCWDSCRQLVPGTGEKAQLELKLVTSNKSPPWMEYEFSIWEI